MNSTTLRRLLATLLAVCFIGGAVVTADDNWTVDFEAAKKIADAQQKSILMEFTGSDWCPPCKALHKNVLSKAVFLEETPKQFVLLKLDNPRDKSKQSEQEIEQYKKLSAEYNIEGVPTIILADPTGTPYAKMVGYSNTSAEEYVADLAEKSKILTKRDTFLSKADEAEGVEKAKLLDQALSLIDTEIAISTYKDVVAQIVAIDADDAAGLKSKYQGVLQSQEVKKRLESIIRENQAKPAEGVARIEELIEEMKPTGEGLQQAVYYKAMLLYSTDKNASKELLLEARKVAPDSKLGGRITAVLKQVFKLDPEKTDDN